jgi:hypothetical protein
MPSPPNMHRSMHRLMHRSSTVRQLALAMAAFVLCALLLESGGLADWAQRLELGPLRTVAVPVTARVERTLAPLHIDRLRTHALVALAHVRWSDDPAAEENASAEALPTSATPATASPTAQPDITKPGVVPDAKLTPPPPPAAAVHLVPMAGDPPLLTALPTFDVIPQKPRIVALAGDSMMAVGLSSTILREAPRYPALTFVKAFKSGTGLARPEVFNWQVEYPAMLASNKPDVVLVVIGANDGQGFVDNGVTYPFGSEGWKRIYQGRVEAFLHTVSANGAQVVWLGLPPMKSDSYNAHIALINRIDYAVVQATPGAVWFSTAGLVGTADGGFQDFGEVNGRTVRLRQGDGIHLSDDGATLVTRKLLPWVSSGREP